MQDQMMGAAWTQGLSFWCQLWQAQIEQSMKFWALWAESLPKPTAAQLAAQAEKMREKVAPAPEPARPARRSRAALAATAEAPAATVH